MKKTYYWCPFIGSVATIRAVLNSAKSLKVYSKNKIEPSIINVVGEWNIKKEIIKKNNIDLIDFQNNIIEKLPTKGFLLSRLTYFIIFFFSILKLHKLLREHKPDYLIVHLITSIPLVLLIIFNYKTKIILRVSGYPKLNFFRTILWKLVRNKLFMITCPTNMTLNLLKEKKIFDSTKLSYLPDPILEVREIIKKKKDKIQLNNFTNKNTILSIGRLTNQKNFNFLLDCFNEIIKTKSELNLFILGDGEERIFLEKKIKKLNLQNKVFLTGYKNNVYKYLKNCRFFILTSKYEDPGFVLVEAGFMNKTVISSDCPNGPIELIEKNKNGYLFKSNSINDFIKTFDQAYNENNEALLKKKINFKKKCKEFTIFQHFLGIKKILN